MKKHTEKKLPVVTSTVRELSAPDLKAIQGGFPPGPCRNPSGG